MAGNVHSGHRQRMFAKYDEHGFEGFHEHEILEMLLFYAIPMRNTNDIAHALLKEFGSLRGVISKPASMLERVENVGPAAARYLSALGDMVDMFESGALTRNLKKLTKENAADYFKGLFKNKQREEFYIICLDSRDNILACKRLSEGGFGNTPVDAGKALKTAMDYDSAQVVFAHNHPSGIAVASDEDITVTGMLEGVMHVAGITMRDHVIVTDKECVSVLSTERVRRDRSLEKRR